MKVYFIGAGPGDPELLTLKAMKILKGAGYCIYAGSLINKEILGYVPKDAKLFDSSKMSLDEVLDIMEKAHEKDIDVARLHSGDPSIYGAIQEQIESLDKKGIEYEIVPGVSSFQAAAASLNQELTLPGVSQTVILTRRAGKTPVPEREALSILAKSRATMCIFLSIDQIEDIARELIPSYGKDCPVNVVYKVTWPDEKIIKTTLSELSKEVKKERIDKTALIIVGHVLSKEFNKSKLYDKNFSHSFRKNDSKT